MKMLCSHTDPANLLPNRDHVCLFTRHNNPLQIKPARFFFFLLLAEMLRTPDCYAAAGYRGLETMAESDSSEKSPRSVTVNVNFLCAKVAQSR